jgi:Transport protein particle (TRAPP) component
MIIDNDPPITRHISIPRDMAQLSCSALTAGIVEAVLDGLGFVRRLLSSFLPITFLWILIPDVTHVLIFFFVFLCRPYLAVFIARSRDCSFRPHGYVPTTYDHLDQT